ncbi:MAG: diaminopimelate epimerase [Zoogloeaceae bacterium]|nr:diaminopimelate epimerase [Zoogloeaceae bacterium]
MAMLRFSKMQGLGNDFVVIDGVRQHTELTPERVRFLADRHFGVGCDQVLLVEADAQAEVDFCYRIFNADGGEVEQCGNGARCFARFVHDVGLTDKREIQVRTAKGVITSKLEADGQVTVDMGAPRFAPAEIPFLADREALTYPLALADVTLTVSALSMGNPHVVQVVADVDAAPVAAQGPLLAAHPRFPQGANAGFWAVRDREHIHLRVFERGAGETLACGTGACAAVVAGIRLGLLDATVEVSTRGGCLVIHWEGAGHPVWMTGPAVSVFRGEIEL